ncbi:GNAT family N-acetyltransferase [Nocardioides sp. GY 10113]|uniref:GNAT family N-acetyltransferase n=1 Tax=Nocardioides sp. GY 10113 TaxID=2569761 RepID=UPI0010A790DA|nr:GNAT family N-acetyltransferase [Nocardioides sp. GY 10113]TIC88210.1 GNAT family N-acetyltransferase [Nocardioides sp. GY 10113]
MADAPALDLRPVGYDHPDAVALVARVQEEYVERYGSPDAGPVDLAEFRGPDGLFLVGYLDSAAVATGAWRRTGVEALGGGPAAEIKRMYVVPERRGNGIARLVLAELERTAARAGVAVLVLETGLKQPEAIALYESAGYVPVPGFGHYRDSPLSRCFGKRLPPLS